LSPNLSLLTDLYQLTMMCGYHSHQKLDQQSCFDLYFRRLPFGGGFCLASGLEPALEWVENLSFEKPQLSYLASLNLFPSEFLEWLGDFRFNGDIWAMPEGELVFPGEPLLRIHAPLPEAQLIESALLNMINFHTLVATKAARVRLAAKDGLVLEFGLRRAQGVNGALAATRAAMVGGCHATSNVQAGYLFDIPVKGTHAHSWIMSFDSELEAFRAYAKTYPDSCTLLVDTYDTLGSGVPNAIKVGQELEAQGHRLAGIRLDSGDLAHLSIESRKLLDQAGMSDAKIVASNDLDEHIISQLKEKGARIDIWGVGTNLVTCKDEPALGGVYKLVAASDSEGWLTPRIKVSSNPIKTTIPGIKQVYRAYQQDQIVGDVLCLADETPSPGQLRSTHAMTAESRMLSYSRLEPLLVPVMKNGKRVVGSESLNESAARAQRALGSLPEEHKKLSEPVEYWVGLSDGLLELRQGLLQSAKA
jgi:nicotinate phosphoribosyltransferase